MNSSSLWRCTWVMSAGKTAGVACRLPIARPGLCTQRRPAAHLPCPGSLSAAQTLPHPTAPKPDGNPSPTPSAKLACFSTATCMSRRRHASLWKHRPRLHTAELLRTCAPVTSFFLQARWVRSEGQGWQGGQEQTRRLFVVRPSHWLIENGTCFGAPSPHSVGFPLQGPRRNINCTQSQLKKPVTQ